MTARWCVLLAATPDAEAFLFLPEGTLLVAADPLQLLLHAHPGPTALNGTQLLLHRTAWTLLLARDMHEHHGVTQKETHTVNRRYQCQTNLTVPQFRRVADRRHGVVGSDLTMQQWQ